MCFCKYNLLLPSVRRTNGVKDMTGASVYTAETFRLTHLIDGVDEPILFGFVSYTCILPPPVLLKNNILHINATARGRSIGSVCVRVCAHTISGEAPLLGGSHDPILFYIFLCLHAIAQECVMACKSRPGSSLLLQTATGMDFNPSGLNPSKKELRCLLFVVNSNPEGFFFLSAFLMHTHLGLPSVDGDLNRPTMGI